MKAKVKRNMSTKKVKKPIVEEMMAIVGTGYGSKAVSNNNHCLTVKRHC